MFSKVERGKKNSVIKWWWKEHNNNHDYLSMELGRLITPSGFPSVILFDTHIYPRGKEWLPPPFMKKLKSKQDKGIDWKWSRSAFRDKSLIGHWRPRVFACTHKTLDTNSFNQPHFPAFTNRRGPSISTCTFPWMSAALHYFQGFQGASARLTTAMIFFACL